MIMEASGNGTDGRRHPVETDSDEEEENALPNLFSYDSVLSAWQQLPSEYKTRVSHSLKISAFWWPILLQQDEFHTTTMWAVTAGFLDSNVCGDISLQRLERIEILESILRAMEKGWLSDKLTEQLIPMSACFQLSRLSANNLRSHDKDENKKLVTEYKVFVPKKAGSRRYMPEPIFCNNGDLTDEALAWLERTGEPNIVKKVQNLGSKYTCYEILRFIFGKFSPLTTEAVSGQSVLLKLKDVVSLEPDGWSREKSEDLKDKGNEHYRKNKFLLALKWYTKAIKHHPTNHVLYGNRAMCFIRIGKYLKAAADGKRATVIKPDWAKGHYRFCEALFLLEEHKKALEANEMAHDLCYSDHDGMKDLERQRAKFLLEMEEIKEEVKPGRSKRKKSSKKRSPSAMVTATELQCDPDLDPGSEVEQLNDELTTEKEEEEDPVSSEAHPGESDIGKENKDIEETKQMESERVEEKPLGATSCPQAKLKMKSRRKPKDKQTQRSKSTKELKEELACTVQDAQVALANQHWFNAKQGFCHALDILDSNSPQELSISELDKLLLMYGYATALLEIGQPQELAEAVKQFVQIQSSSDERFECLIYYGMGRVFLKENRFSEALGQFSEAVLVVERKVTPGEVTWPTTDVPVQDGQMEHLRNVLEKSIGICRFPPKPDAVCRHNIVQDHLKREIYFTDPGFKGFHRMVCSQRCVVEFHTNCWKKIKTAAFPDNSDKDFLQKACLTPDCSGKICHIVIVGSTGHVKCEFESTIPKQKPRLKQRSTRPKVVKIKEERKLKHSRQEASVSVQDHLGIKENATMGEGCEKGTIQAWLDEDHVLRQIGEMRDHFGDETLGVSALKTSLKPWIERDLARGLDCPAVHVEALVVLKDMVDMLLKRKSRVWARIFIHELTSCVDLKPKLFQWAQHLNSQGLKAAKAFIERYAEPLEELDLGLLLTFSPLQDALIERFGTMPDLFSRDGLTVTEYLRQASPQEMRLFIWTLEENKDEYPSFHAVLDEYFATDCSYLVIKKAEHENSTNQLPKKSKSKRKKTKESKSVFVLSGMGTGASREEKEEDYLYEEDSFMLFDSIDPFTVPDYLRDQVAEFEEECLGTEDTVHIRRNAYNIPDPTREYLYDYFAQVLKERGPLKIDDPLLVGELENFPPDSQEKIGKSGGLKPFLLESLRFIVRDDVVGLMKHAGAFLNLTPEQRDSYHCCFEGVTDHNLNPFAEEFYPNYQPSRDIKTGISGTKNFATSENLSDYLVKLHRDGKCLPFTRAGHESRKDLCAQSSKPSHSPLGPTSETGRHFEVCVSSCKQTGACSSPNAVQDWKTEAVASSNERGDAGNSSHGVMAHSQQVFSTVGDDVAVNTEVYELFENMKGDMTKKEKDNIKCKNKVPQLKKNIESNVQKRKADLSQYQNVHDEICQQIEMVNKDLCLFQQKFDEEMKMYQPEKKENQETLKMLKAKISSLSAANDSVATLIMEENKKYEAKHTHLTTMRKQMAAEKENVKIEIVRYKHLSARQTKRSQFAAKLLLESRQAQSVRALKRCVYQGKAILGRIAEVSPRYPSSGLNGLTESWRACVHDAEQKISQTQAQYRQQMEMVKDGTALCRLPQVPVPVCPPRPSEPVLDLHPPTHHLGPRQTQSHHSAQMPARFPNLNYLQFVDVSADIAAHEANAQHVREQMADQASGAEAQFEMAAARLYSPFRQPGRSLPSHVRKNMSISGPRTDQMHSTESQSGLFSPQADGGQMASRPYSPGKSSGAPPAWKCEAAQGQTVRRALNMEDPCIICHEDVHPENLYVLECRHGFHNECIRPWLSTHSTCPTCRKHVLPQEEFPGLPVRFDKSSM